MFSVYSVILLDKTEMAARQREMCLLQNPSVHDKLSFITQANHFINSIKKTLMAAVKYQNVNCQTDRYLSQDFMHFVFAELQTISFLFIFADCS